MPGLKFRLILVLSLLTAYASASSATVVHDESLDGDLPTMPATVGTLSLGSNEFLGSLQQDDVDSFTFIIASGHVLETLIITNYPGRPLLDSELLLYSGSEISGRPLANIRCPTSPTPSECIGLDILQFGIRPPGQQPEGTYSLQLSAVGDAIIQSILVEWGLDLVVGESELPPVPLPAAAWLFGTALVGLAGFVKRRKTALI